MVIIGDVHGTWQRLQAAIEARDIWDQHLIQVGDFGIGFMPAEREAAALGALDRFLADRGCRLWAIRGNHDNPHRFIVENVPAYQAIHLVPDYTVLRLEGHAILCVGGAVSVDRTARHPGIYWPEERFNLQLDRLAMLDLHDLDCVVTHSAPLGLPPLEVGALVHSFVADDPTLLAELRAERRDLGALAEGIARYATPRYWFYGHYHQHASTQIDATRYVLLDILEMFSLPAILA